MRELNRVAPVGPTQAYKTYSIIVPKATHTRPATCEEVDCPNYLNGWKTILSLSTQAGLIHTVKNSGRGHTELVDGDLVTFTFAPGQTCFQVSKHRIQVQQELYVVRGGDHRGNPTGMKRIHQKPLDWVEDFALHTNKISDELRKG
jgi:hypothetical protein